MALNIWLGEWLPGLPLHGRKHLTFGKAKNILGGDMGQILGGYVFYPWIPGSFLVAGENPRKHRGLQFLPNHRRHLKQCNSS